MDRGSALDLIRAVNVFGGTYLLFGPSRRFHRLSTRLYGEHFQGLPVRLLPGRVCRGLCWLCGRLIPNLPPPLYVHFWLEPPKLGVALVKVKVVLSVVVNTIFWWSASNHRGQILFSRSDNMDLCCKGFSDGGEGEVCERVEQLLSTNSPVALNCRCADSEEASSERGSESDLAEKELSAWCPLNSVHPEAGLHVKLCDVIAHGSDESGDLREMNADHTRWGQTEQKKERMCAPVFHNN